MASPSPPLIPAQTSLGVKLGYSLGNLGKSLIWASFESFMLFYLVAVLGMDPLIAGALLAATLVWDGLADVAVAYWTDRRGRSDMLARLIAVGAPMVALGFWGIFGAAPGPGRIVTMLAVVLCRLGYTLCDVGHNTLMVRVAAHPRDAATVSGLRLIFSAMGGALVGLATAQGLAGPLAAQKAALEGSAALAAILYLITLLTAMLVSRRLRCGPRAR
jgi:Na+/melibiose symporter-like transporter